MKIGELARIAHCTPDTIRFYEKEGLLQAARRTEANHRTYDEAHIERLRFIRNCRDLAMTHAEVRTLLHATRIQPAECCAIDALIGEHIGDVSTRIDELTRLRNELVALRKQCHGEKRVDACGIMRALASSKLPVRPKARKSRFG